MFDGDLEKYLKEFRHTRWRVARVGTRLSSLVALHFVFKLEETKQLKKVAARINLVRKQWIARLRELIVSGLWIQDVDIDSVFFNEKKFLSAYLRCLYCKPTCAYFYAKKNQSAKFKPCWRSNFCPFCWANLAGLQYVIVKRTLNRLLKTDRLICTVRVLAEAVEAPGFAELVGLPEEAKAVYIKKLQAVIARHKHAYQQLVAAKKFKASAIYGSLWRIVVVPTETGWNVETRQLFLAKPNSALPFVRLRGATVVALESTKSGVGKPDLRDTFFHIFGRFCAYPETLLTGYVELTAVYLHATIKQRLSGGTGVLRKTGRRLVALVRRLKTKTIIDNIEKDSHGSSEEIISRN